MTVLYVMAKKLIFGSNICSPPGDRFPADDQLGRKYIYFTGLHIYKLVGFGRLFRLINTQNRGAARPPPSQLRCF
jgi:hypothetical protein